MGGGDVGAIIIRFLVSGPASRLCAWFSSGAGWLQSFRIPSRALVRTPRASDTRGTRVVSALWARRSHDGVSSVDDINSFNNINHI